ncbi:hypothetical protein BH09CHL1_BH09CHL1_10220 [soil metagenome]
MRKLLLVVVLAALLPGSVRAEETSFARGVNVVYYGSDAHDPEAIDELLDTLKGMNVDSILLTYPIYLDGWQGSTIRDVYEPDEVNPNGDTPTEDELAAFVKPAIAAGFSVMLRPLIDEQVISRTGPSGSWRGTYQPEDQDAFFADLGAILDRTASFAGELGVSWIVIGSELNALEKSQYNYNWEAIINSMRIRIGDSGVGLTYAQNWDTGMYLGFPSWLNLLDAVSIDAYFPANGTDSSSSADDVAVALSQWTSNLQALQDQAPGKPLFITEAGVASQDSDPNVLTQPWSWPNESLPVDRGVQALYAEGACKYFRGVADPDGGELVSGLFWWQTSVGHAEDAAEDRTFDFVGKPAADQIAACYSR